ncbi:hypothetical protein HZU75_05195 [Chitinibacter fontanus]|uniref:Uncharacterized protein n=1 Tax=Chitinibacter fontanus TaxID=1737446 RepID=A0A7D5ZFR4_9NEIS|nr:hypothetical protein [Chitinibacter fontanus]QLI80967.1 hypothetical protein HZU75_05195 [Chitinibacter fontanus]
MSPLTQADQRHAAVMAALLKSSAWLMLPTLLHQLFGRQQSVPDYLGLSVAVLQFFWGWRCLFDGYLFAAVAQQSLDETALDQMLWLIFGRAKHPPLSMLQRLQGARRVWCWFLGFTLAYWLTQAFG